jgi:hypothetical protein
MTPASRILDISCWLLDIPFLPAFISLLRRRPDRPALDELGFDPRLAAIFLSLADVIDPAHDAVHHRAAAPADMRNRWTTRLEMRVVVDADQGEILRHPDTPVEQKVERCEIVGAGAGDDRGGWRDLERRVKVGIQTFESSLPTR